MNILFNILVEVFSFEEPNRRNWPLLLLVIAATAGVLVNMYVMPW